MGHNTGGKYRRTTIQLKSKSIKVYASPRISEALREVLKDMSLYQGVRFGQILGAVYEQGTKDGARAAFEETEQKFLEARRAIPHRTPGRPKKR